MSLQARLDQILQRYTWLGTALEDAELSRTLQVAYAKERSQLETVAETVQRLEDLERERADAQALLDTEHDPELRAMAEAELERLDAELPNTKRALKGLLLPKDAEDARNVIVEIRPGTGGDEAALFAAELVKMYQLYAATRGWKVEVMEWAESDLGGIKDACISIVGANAFSFLKFESGVHRVQRVPATESGGRLHTSTATVAVLPEAEDVDITIHENDLRIDVFRSSGPGGQSVNTTDSAIRITHLPSGLIVSQQDERSQHKNKAKAMKILATRLYDLERQKKADARASDRKTQVGTGDRSERIRTYNFSQNRVTDHRIGFSTHDLERVLAGETLQAFITALTEAHQADRLASLGESV